MRHYAFVLPYLAGLLSLSAQLFPGTNAPNTALDFSVPIGAGASNLSFIVGGTATAYSYVLIQKDTPPSDTTYDFSSQVIGQTNAVYLEAPEASAGTYYIRVRTPATSLTHAFTLQVQTNRTDLRASMRPVTKLLGNIASGAATNGSWEYFRVELKTNLAWRINVNSTNSTSPDVYADYSALGSPYKVPTTASLKKSVAQTNDLVAYTATEAQPGVYSIAVNGTAVGRIYYTLDLQPVAPANLNWDPGLADAGTETITNTSGLAGDYYFKIVTQSPSLSAWRTALRVFTTNADANLYLKKGALPTPTTADYSSTRVGSDGIVLDMASSTQPIYANEVWYILVRAAPGAQWSLLSGAPFVTDLGTLAADGSSGSGDVTIGPEGMRFFSTTVPSAALAWRLWLNGQTNLIRLRKGNLPLPTVKDMEQAQQMLIVSPYLNAGQVFIAVPGTPDSPFNLDSRQQPVVDLAYGASTATNFSGYGYTTYRVVVPSGEIAWQIYLPSTNGNPNLAVRQGLVPNDQYNDAFSELAGNVADNITLVWPTLSSGTYYITVYQASTNAAQFTLQNGPAAITDIHYSTVITNDDPARVGWRFYRVSNLTEQQNSIGWDLYLTNFTPGTRIALRPTKAPGIWNYRNPGQGTTAFYDLISAADFLQQMDHQPDTWYIGVYNPSNALGAFTLVTRELPVANLADNTPAFRTNVLSGRWEIFHVQLNPEDLQDTSTNGTVVGWDLRLANITSGNPHIVVRRDRYPTNLNTTIGSGGNTWPSCLQWAAAGDWTKRTFSPDGAINEDGRILAMPVGRPLEPGSYYIGVLNAPGFTNLMSYSLLSRWIGRNRAIPLVDLDWSNGCITNTLDPREAAYYRIVVPPSVPSWKARLRTLTGEAMLQEGPNWIPGINPADTKGMQKTGNEQYVRLPSSGTNYLAPGTNFFAVISEGVAPSAANRIGSGPSTFAIESLGTMPLFDLGTLSTSEIVTNGSLEAGASVAYHVHVDAGVLGYYIRLTNTTGNPWFVSRPGLAIPDPGGKSDAYGNEGGETSGTMVISPDWGGWVISDTSPPQDFTIVVKARPTGSSFPDATYTLDLQPITAQPISFDPSTNLVLNSSEQLASYFRIAVPSDARGWDVRLTDVLSGAPMLVVSRHILAYDSGSGIKTSGFNPSPFTGTNWPFLAEWVADTDWTARYLSADGYVNEKGEILAMGMQRPLESDVYYISVIGTGGLPINCKLVSRGIGTNYSIPVPNLDFYSGQVTNTLPPREAAYYHVAIPAGVSSWKVQLSSSNGETMLIALKDTLPNVGAGQPAAQGWSVLNSGGRKMQKIGDEQFLLLPSPGQDFLTPGDYYLAVVSEGQVSGNPTWIGYDPVTYTLKCLGTLPITNLGTVGPSPNELVESNFLQGGEVRLYQFSVASGTQILEARLDRWSGNPAMSLRPGARVPDPGAASPLIGQDTYGNDGGEALGPGTNAAPLLLSYLTPTNGLYTLAVKARTAVGWSQGQVISNASYTLHLSAKNTNNTNPVVVINPVTFESATTVTNQPAGSWYYFPLDVPTNALGWDVRLINVSSGSPRLTIRRASYPTAYGTTGGWSPNGQSTWPSNNQWAAAYDWTGRKNSADGLTDETCRIMAMGMGHPLQPGFYYIGVTNASTNNASFTLLSRGIGDSNFFSIPVLDLPYTGALTNWSLRAREAAYYRVIVPSNSPSWKLDALGLTNVGGEFLVSAYRNALPTTETTDDNGTLQTGKRMSRPGDEHYVQLPTPGIPSILPGTNFLAVVSEGQNPSSAQNIGPGSSGYILTSGQLIPTDLGQLTSDDLLLPDRLACGEVKAYQFTVPPDTYGMKLRLENRTGKPVMIIRQGSRFVDPGAGVNGLTADKYGNEGGENPASTDGNTNMLTVPNPWPDTYTVIVKARPNGSTFSDANFTLRVQEILVPELSFSAEENPYNGLTNGASGTLEDNERTFFKFYIPDGQLGWRLNLSQGSGQAGLRVYQGALPSDLNPNQMPFTNGTIVIAPPYLTPGEWFVEVKGSGSTVYSLVSSALSLARPAWIMPSPGDTNHTPGLSLPIFADTDYDTNGAYLGGGGIFLAQGDLNYYAVVVPGTNLGLLTATLQVMNGNPELYLRAGSVPTLSHSLLGGYGALYDRALSGSTNTMYANWVPLDGKTNTQLLPGVYYLAVRASGTLSANYKLSLSVGKIFDLPLDGTTLTNQVILGDGDWLYYRLAMPAALPLNFTINLRQDYGSVLMHFRDVIPPGTGTNRLTSQIKDWNTDMKNFGPYSNNVPPGIYSFSAPPVRPGQILYLGMRSATHSAFSISAATNGAPAQEPQVVPFYGGSVLTNVPPYSTVLLRVDVPWEATRWKHSSTHSTNLVVYLDQGTLPIPVLSPVHYCWKSTSPNNLNSTNNTPLAVWDNTNKVFVPDQAYASKWPWVTAQSYFLVVTNTSGIAQDFALLMDGRNAILDGENAHPDDNDNNGIPDVWELTYFGTNAISPSADYDRDGFSNLEEFQARTDPTDPASFRARLTINATNGTVARNPDEASYALGSHVILTPVPNSGYSFIGWSGNASGSANPLNLLMDAHKTVTANFKLAGDNFATALPISGTAAVISSSNVGYTKEPGEPNHAGNPGGKSIWWRWTAPASGSVSLSTAGSSFTTLLAAYTGNSLSNLTCVGADINSSGIITNRSLVHFNAAYGTTYYIAVDGYNGASSRIVLSLNFTNAVSRPRLTPLACLPNGTAQFTISGDANQNYVVEASSDLLSWTNLGTITTSAGGSHTVSDPGAASLNRRFYRVHTP